MKSKWFWLILLVVLAGGLTWAGLQYKQRKWRGRERFTIVELGGDIRISSFDPELKTGVVIEIPRDLEVESVGGRGKWQAGSLVAAGFGKKWAADSLADYLGVGYTGELSSLSKWDQWEWSRWQKQIIWKNVDMVGSGVVSDITAVDGTRFRIVSEKWPQARDDWFLSAVVVNENLNVKIDNTTGIAGLGAHASRFMEAEGMTVRQLVSSNTEVGQCSVETNAADEKTYGVGWLVMNLGCKWREGNEALGEVTVVLGGDYRKWWLGNSR